MKNSSTSEQVVQISTIVSPEAGPMGVPRHEPPFKHKAEFSQLTTSGVVAHFAN